MCDGNPWHDALLKVCELSTAAFVELAHAASYCGCRPPSYYILEETSGKEINTVARNLAVLQVSEPLALTSGAFKSLFKRGMVPR